MAKGIEDFEIYRLAERLEIYCHRVLKTIPNKEFRARDQLKRSTSSATDNISEGYSRYAYNDKKHKFIIARGEAMETRQGFLRAYKKGLIPKKVSDLIENKYTELIKMINGYIRFLNKKNDEKLID